ncbi:glycosyltransferase [Gramella sp. AN32]|uniref:Glycosyltransferase n=1 Tax=Christiangramia antarctica TaxID=2058158 RepID=A0ABW5X6W3_9FLAO|nr:glycosyltransferase [Gramella sp. AN32]MCM4157778.1 glycosyl transferase family 2 [Gramella sp. AN32]
MLPEYSFIIPVFNRPDEIRELLKSMLKVDAPVPFEIIIVEDGSTLKSDAVIKEFSDKLDIHYYSKSNSGPGDSRNFGMGKATSNYFLILDSDVLLPANYLREVHAFLNNNNCDCFGGPDAAHHSFSKVQKAIDYSMTSFYTTGGIRGSEKAVDEFQPRSFNMGMSRKAFLNSKGFGSIHPGEDPDLSLRLKKEGFKICLIPEAKVFHKRRIDWRKFYIQVKKFGLVRPILNKWHPGSAKITYWFPSFFTLGFIISIITLLLGFKWLVIFYLIYFLMIGIDAAIKTGDFYIGLLAIKATIIQFLGYGLGFLESSFRVGLMNGKPQEVFPKLFFKT